MKKAFLTAVVIEMAFLSAVTTPSLADDLPALNSQWRETQRGLCFEITQISGPFPGSAGCVQIAGRMNEGDLMIGYACKSDSEISLFFRTTNRRFNKARYFYWGYSSAAIAVRYCTRISNDWPPEYNCETGMTFQSVSSCKP